VTVNSARRVRPCGSRHRWCRRRGRRPSSA
jgi:hypothetical protein